MRVVVLGASTKEERYSNRAVKLLKSKGHDVVPVGRREGSIDGVDIRTGFPRIADVHTITMYVGAQNQPEFYEYIYSLNPKRVIFNPGAENPDFAKHLNSKGVTTEDACTLVMLNLGVF